MGICSVDLVKHICVGECVMSFLRKHGASAAQESAAVEEIVSAGGFTPVGDDVDLIGLEALIDNMTGAMDIHDIIDAHGAQEGIVAYALKTQLLSSTAVALESIATDPDGSKTAALEGIVDWIKGAGAALIEKAASSATALVGKIKEWAAAAVTKATEMGAWLKQKTIDAKAVIKAHPYASAAAAVVALAAVGAIASVIWAGGIPNTVAALTAWTTKIKAAVAALKVPTLTIEIKGSTMSLSEVPGAIKSGATSALNWTQANAGKFASAAKDGMSKFGSTMAGILPKIAGVLKSGLSVAAKFSMDLFRTWLGSVRFALHVTWNLFKYFAQYVKTIIIGTATQLSGATGTSLAKA
jgi:hypothetical protein